MNRRLTLLLIAAVSAILPAVAVADVMITGNVGVNGTANTAVFTFHEGSNFQAADGSVQFTDYSAGQTMAHIGFGMVSNQTTFIINVLEIHFKSTLAPGMFYLNSTGISYFPAGSMMYLSLSPMSFGDFTYTGLPGATPVVTNPAITSFSLSGPSTYSSPVTGGTIIYIGFFTPAYDGLSTTGEMTLTGTYLSG